MRISLFDCVLSSKWIWKHLFVLASWKEWHLEYIDPTKSKNQHTYASINSMSEKRITDSILLIYGSKHFKRHIKHEYLISLSTSKRGDKIWVGRLIYKIWEGGQVRSGRKRKSGLNFLRSRNSGVRKPITTIEGSFKTGAIRASDHAN